MIILIHERDEHLRQSTIYQDWEEYIVWHGYELPHRVEEIYVSVYAPGAPKMLTVIPKERAQEILQEIEKEARC